MAAKKRPAQQIPKRYPPYLLARQIAALKKLSDDTETPVQYHIREAIDEYLERRKKKTKRNRSAVAS
jgi:predicted DNA-binding protein